MIAYIPHTFHSVRAYYACSTTAVRKRFIDAYCMYVAYEGHSTERNGFVTLFCGAEQVQIYMLLHKRLANVALCIETF